TRELLANALRVDSEVLRAVAVLREVARGLLLLEPVDPVTVLLGELEPPASVEACDGTRLVPHELAVGGVGDRPGDRSVLACLEPALELGHPQIAGLGAHLAEVRVLPEESVLERRDEARERDDRRGGIAMRPDESHVGVGLDDRLEIADEPGRLARPLAAGPLPLELLEYSLVRP